MRCVEFSNNWQLHFPTSWYKQALLYYTLEKITQDRVSTPASCATVLQNNHHYLKYQQFFHLFKKPLTIKTFSVKKNHQELLKSTPPDRSQPKNQSSKGQENSGIVYADTMTPLQKRGISESGFLHNGTVFEHEMITFTSKKYARIPEDTF